MTFRSAVELPAGLSKSTKLASGQVCMVGLDLVGPVDALSPSDCLPVWLVLLDVDPAERAPKSAVEWPPSTLSFPAVVVKLTPSKLAPCEDSPEEARSQRAGDTLTSVLRALSSEGSRELILLGEGAAGIEALRQGAALGTSASTLVWALSATASSSGGTEPDDVEPAWGRRSVILWDAADPSLRRSIGPLARAGAYVHRGRGLHTTAAGQSLIVVDLDPSEKNLLRDVLEPAVSELCNPRTPARAVFEALQRSGVVDQSRAVALPRDLRDDADELLSGARIDSDRVADGRQSVYLKGFRSGVGGMHFEFCVKECDGSAILHGPDRTDSPKATFAADTTGRLEVAILDGFGNRLQTMRAAWPMESSQRTPHAPRVFVYGSCVTRDAFALEGAPPLADYIARSPLGSAFSNASSTQGLIRLEDNPSAFQRRMVAVDFDKSLKQLLSSTPFDLLVLDFIDERLSMMRTPAGYVTYSNEAHACGMRPASTDLVVPGSDEHLTQFVAGLELLLSVVPAHRILLNKVYWSTVTMDGTPLDNADAIKHNNAILDALYSEASDRHITAIGYDHKLFRSDPGHKWGLSPFHYAHDLYARTLDGIFSAHKPLVT